MAIFKIFEFTEKKLAKEIIKSIKKYKPEVKIIYNQERREIFFGDHYIYLGNIFLAAKNKEKEERAFYIDSFVQSMLNEVPKNYDEIENLLVPRIKTLFERSMRDINNQIHGKENGIDICYRPITDEFVIELGIDFESSIKIMDKKFLNEAGKTFNEAYKRAFENLKSISDDMFEELSPGLYRSRFDDDHDAARVLLVDQIRSLTLNGNPVAFIPTPNNLFITGSADAEGLQQCINLSQKAIQTARQISLFPLILHQDEWFPCRPEDTTATLDMQQLLRVAKSSDYQEQKEALDSLNGALSKDIFVASFSVYKNKDTHKYFSCASLTEGVLTWLPKTDKVFMGRVKETGEFDMVGIVSCMVTPNVKTENRQS